jgi:very-short-patch-repair endonuclease
VQSRTAPVCDGSTNARADAVRDAVLQRAEYRVLRFEARLIECEIEAVVALIRAEL